MFLILSAAPEPERDALAGALARGLARIGAVRVLGCGPSRWDVSPEGIFLPAAPRMAREDGPVRLAFAVDSPSVRALGRARIAGDAAWVAVSARARELDDDALELALGAAQVWRLPGGRPERRLADARWLRRRVGPLLAPSRRLAPRRPLISLVIPVHGALPLLRECLLSISRHTAAPYEIILVDNASDAATRRYLRSRRGARLIENARNLGFARAVNQGMRAARGTYIAWVNSDTRVTPGWLERLADVLKADPALAAVGPVTNRIAGAALVPVPAGFSPTAAKIDALGTAYALKNAGQVQEVHRLTGFCLLLRRSAVRSVGLLDERFGLGCYEDYDYCLRLKQAGYTLAAARDVFVYHSYHGSFKSDAGHREQLLKNRAIFIEKWCARALDFLDHLDPILTSS